MTTLVKIVRKYYEENSRHEAGPPVRLIKELEYGSLVLSDLEISDEDIPVLTRFFNTRQAWEQVKKIEINRSSGGKVNMRRNASALNLNSHKLFKDLLEFVSKCTHLEIITFEHIEIEMPVIFALCKALLSTTSPLRWLAFRCCDICGDNGLKELTPYLGKLQLQVLGFECCQLTDQSLPFITSILKAQENNLDNLLWNATLRLDPAEQNVELLNEATSFVYSHGLVALSLWGNQISGRGILMLTRLLRKNSWLLGLNFAENKIDEINMSILVDELKSNTVLQAILLRNNPGVDITLGSELCRSVMAKSKDPSESYSGGFARLKVLDPRVSWLLNSWMRLQCEETRDLIQGRVLSNYFDEASKSAPRKPKTRESPKEAYLRSYSVFNYLADPDVKSSLPVHPSRDDEDDPVLYDFSGNGNARLSVDPSTRHSSSHAADRYNANTTSTLTNSVGHVDGSHALFHQRIQERELLFRPSISSPQLLTHGAEYDESVDASIDHRPSHRLSKAKQQADDLERAIAVASPTRATSVKGRKNGDADGWEYWPNGTSSMNTGRPPSRISIRPKHDFNQISTERGRSSDYNTANSRHRSTSRERTGHNQSKIAWGEKKHVETNRSVSPSRRAWVPSSFVPKVSDGMRKSTSPKKNLTFRERSSSPASLKKPQIPRVKSKKVRSRKQQVEKAQPIYDEITSSVLAATKNLEHVSRRLRDVAETLSESALMNNSASDIDNSRLARAPIEVSSPSRQNKLSPQDNQHPQRNQIFTSQEVENVQFAELVRQRMKTKLRDYLTKELETGWN